MVENMKQPSSITKIWGDEMDLMASLIVWEGLKTRDGKEVKIARSVMMVR